MVEEWIGLREFARRRGVRLAAVQKAIASGRVTAIRRSADGARITGIEANVATAQWNAMTDPVQAARSGQVLGAAQGGLAATGTPVPAQAPALPPMPPAPPAGEPGDDEAGKEDKAGYYLHREKREKFAAQTAELEYFKAIGELVPAREIREASMRRYRAIRDKVLNIPDRVSAVLVGEAASGERSTAEARVHALLSRELKRVLHELSDEAAADAAGGTAERMAA